MSVFHQLLTAQTDVFTLKIRLTADDLSYGFTPYWNYCSFCRVYDWGDGTRSEAAASGTMLTHTYSAPGEYTLRIRANCYWLIFGDDGDERHGPKVIDSNGNWCALGRLTCGDRMFRRCYNAVFAFKTLPENLETARSMFASAYCATLPITRLPETLTAAHSMFANCKIASLPLVKLPNALKEGTSMFNCCFKATLPFASLPSALTSGSYMFYRCEKAKLPLSRMPDALNNCDCMFTSCYAADLRVANLPANITSASSMFSQAQHAVMDISTWAQNAPAGGWSKLASVYNICDRAGTALSPGGVTGSKAAFYAKCPLITPASGDFNLTNVTE